MNTQLLDSLAQIINTLTPQEKEILKQKINSNISSDNHNQENLSWHHFNVAEFQRINELNIEDWEI